MGIRVGILTASDAGARGERADTSGQVIQDMLASLGAAVVRRELVPDEPAQIRAGLQAMADDWGLDLVLTTGGTGLGPRDVTPEATLAVIERLVPGIPEAMRAAGMGHTPRAMLSRSVAGVRGRTLIINLPGSPRGVRESLEAVLEVLPHAVQLVRGAPTDH